VDKFDLITENEESSEDEPVIPGAEQALPIGEQVEDASATKGAQLTLVLIVLALYLTLAISNSLTKCPIVDEGWFASPALNLATKGSMGTSVLEDSGILNRKLAGIKEYTYWVMPLHLVAQAGWYHLLPFSLFTMRALSISWGLVGLAAWFLIVKNLSGDSKPALLAFALIALDYIFIMHASIGRMDMMCAALGFAALAAYMSLRARGLMWAVLASQSLVVASGLTHPNGIMSFIGVLFLTVYFDRARLEWRYLAVALAPYLLGALAWGLYILRSPSIFLAQFGNNASDRVPGLVSPWSALKLEITQKYLEAYGFAPYTTGPAHLKILILLAYVAAVVLAVSVRSIRQHKGYRALLVLTAIYFVSETFFNHKLVFYLVHIMPFYAAILAVTVYWCWSKWPARRWIVVFGIGAFVLLQSGSVTYRIQQRDYQRNFVPAATYLKENSNQSTLIMASAEMAFGPGFDRVIDDPRLGYYTGKTPDYLVVGVDYDELFKLLQSTEPNVYQHVNSLLTYQCKKVYDHTAYRIYRCR
jgi:hypothetical protein